MKVRAMTKKQEEQLVINCAATGIFNEAFKELENQTTPVCKRLRSCSAWVYETDNFYFLKSYDTFVACICKRNNACFDVLRYVYGYTSTSAQHIAKFFSDYAFTIGKWRSDLTIYTYRDI